MRGFRIIPVLTIIGQQLVKTLRFDKPKYIGDPINAIKIFNEKEVDELVILDIRASVDGKEPNYKLIEEMAGESFMPLGYGGGIKSKEQAQRVFQCGVEKIVLNSVCLDNPQIITELAGRYGSQSIVVSLDYDKKMLRGNRPVFYSAKKNINKSLVEWGLEIEKLGAGEIILQCVDRDGTFDGYDTSGLKEMTSALSIPVVACAGARGYNDFKTAIEQCGASAVAAGSHFVFKNNNRDSILINYNKGA